MKYTFFSIWLDSWNQQSLTSSLLHSVSLVTDIIVIINRMVTSLPKWAGSCRKPQRISTGRTVRYAPACNCVFESRSFIFQRCNPKKTKLINNFQGPGRGDELHVHGTGRERQTYSWYGLVMAIWHASLLISRTISSVWTNRGEARAELP